VTPNARALKHYQDLGFLAAIVEHWSPFPKPFGKRHDLFGIFDLLVVKPQEVWGVQATSNSNVADRIDKLKASDHFWKWKELGGKVAVVGFAKMGKAGRRKVWTMKEIIL